MKTKEQKLPEWFNGVVYINGDVVTNRFTGEEYELNNVELSMYDFIMGATLMYELGMHHDSLVTELRKGLDWFKKYNPTAYMALLD
tara:strand:+ start:472 stop:729 length:258 start_codon:yes stop_codon:yes gene_type:complete